MRYYNWLFASEFVPYFLAQVLASMRRSREITLVDTVCMDEPNDAPKRYMGSCRKNLNTLYLPELWLQKEEAKYYGSH